MMCTPSQSPPKMTRCAVSCPEELLRFRGKWGLIPIKVGRSQDLSILGLLYLQDHDEVFHNLDFCNSSPPMSYYRGACTFPQCWNRGLSFFE